MSPSASLTAEELAQLLTRVFGIGPADTRLLVLVDLPSASLPDNPRWSERRALAAGWARALASYPSFPLQTELVLYPNVQVNNAELPEQGWLWQNPNLPAAAEAIDPGAGQQRPLAELLASRPLVLAVTELSATAPLKLAARAYGLRAATMPGFSRAMIPALRLDYTEVGRRVELLQRLLDRAERASFRFAVQGGAHHALQLDLRHRQAHASSGLMHLPGTAGNLPSGEAFIVPYEGEVAGQPSRSTGELPVQLGAEVVCYRIEQNRAVTADGSGPRAREEAARLAAEPAYGNLAELGLGVLAGFGLAPVGEILLDEKLGLHLAFGRSDHFGGQVGPGQFSRPEAVVHLDRVYLPQTQPLVQVELVELELEDGENLVLMREGQYAIDFGAAT